MRHIAIAIPLMLGGFALSSPAIASRGEHGGRSANTFAGSCQFTGKVEFQPPLTDTPQQGRDTAAASGPCSGSFTDRHGRIHELDGSTVEYVARDEGLTSCGEGLSSGGGMLLFPWGRIAYALTEARGPGGGTLQLSGRRGGSASGTATVSQSENPVQISQQCAGPGLKSVAVNIAIATTPTISG